MRVIIYCECDRMPLISYISIPQLHPLDGNVLRYERVPIAEICANKSRRKSNQVYPVNGDEPLVTADVADADVVSWRKYFSRFFLR